MSEKQSVLPALIAADNSLMDAYEASAKRVLPSVANEVLILDAISAARQVLDLAMSIERKLEVSE